MSARRVLRCAATAAVLGLTATACGEAPGYDAAAVESHLVDDQADAFGPTGGVRKASCPSGLPLEEGMTFTCTLEVSGTTVPYRVRLTEVRGDRVSVSASADGVVIAARDVVAYVRGMLPKASRDAEVTCDSAILVAAVGDSLPCSIARGAQQEDLRITVEDVTGRVSLVS